MNKSRRSTDKPYRVISSQGTGLFRTLKEARAHCKLMVLARPVLYNTNNQQYLEAII